jgi:catechol 2,3-dioxygenase-like lactoylglutathione lyase family enzyme
MEAKMEFDHIALNVKSIQSSVQWYRENTGATVEYEDDTWAMLKIGNTKIALTLPGQHPPHVAFRVDSIADFPEGCEVKQHRDGSWYYYDVDDSGNVIEWIKYD